MLLHSYDEVVLHHCNLQPKWVKTLIILLISLLRLSFVPQYQQWFASVEYLLDVIDHAYEQLISQTFCDDTWHFYFCCCNIAFSFKKQVLNENIIIISYFLHKMLHVPFFVGVMSFIQFPQSLFTSITRHKAHQVL